MTEAGSIRVKIIGDDKHLSQTLKQTTTDIAKWSAAAGLAAAAVGIAMTKAGLSAVDANAKLARSLNTTIDSLKALQLAAGDSGIEGLEGSITRLNRRLGAAELGMGDAAKSVEVLGLNLKELSAMAVDERIASISDAIRDSGMSMQQAARHAQNLGFEQKEAAAFFMQGGDAIRAYKEEVQALGLSVSQFDATQVEKANDAMSRFGMITQGVQQQMAIESAPYLTAISKQIVESVKEFGGMKQVVKTVFDYVIAGAGYAGNALHGIKIAIKSLSLGFDGLAVSVIGVFKDINDGIAKSIDFVIDKINVLIEASNKFLKTDISELTNPYADGIKMIGFLHEAATEAMIKTQAELLNMINSPLPSTQIEDWAANIKVQAEEARKAFEESVGVMTSGGGSGDNVGSPENDKLKKQLEQKLEIIRESFLTEDELAEERLKQQLESLQAGFEMKLISEEEYLMQKAMLEQRYMEESYDNQKKFKDAEEKLEEQKNRAKLNMTKSIFGNLSSLMNTENRRLFEIGKAAAIAQATINTFQGVSSALKDVPFPYNLAAAAAVGIAGAVQISGIASTNFGSTGSATSFSGGQPAVNTQSAQAPAQEQASAPAGGTLSVSGLTANSLFTGDMVAGLAEELLDYQRSGGTVVLQG